MILSHQRIGEFMKLIIAIAFTLTSVSSFATSLECIRNTQSSIESIKVVSNYKFALIKAAILSETELEKEKASVALEKLTSNIIDITYEACEAAEPK
jgi:CRISPR/Cas system CMR-associated protein Cmr3 (group 5 of RAMP superfamily)